MADEPLYNNPRYFKIGPLGSGGYGFVQLAQDKSTGEKVAIKFIERGSKVTKEVQREILNLRTLAHDNVVKFKEVILTDQYVGIVMEYVSGGNLYEYVVANNSRLSEPQARWIFQQFVAGLDYCHKKGVVNRDIKLENTLVDRSQPQPRIKICDFGFSKHTSIDSAPKSKVGTPLYVAPEVINCGQGQTYDGKCADVWSCGVLLYVILVGAYPFERQQDATVDKRVRLHNIYQRIMRADYVYPSWTRLSEGVKDLIGRIFVADCSQRITLDGVISHPWFTQDLELGLFQGSSSQPPPQQSKAEIEAIIKAATTLPGPAVAPEDDLCDLDHDELDHCIQAALQSYEEEAVC